MKIERSRPPNYDAIIAAFPWVAKTIGVIFAWDDRIYNPHGITVTPSLLAHEIVHSQRQKGDPVSWWDKYLIDPAFRFAEEVPAHIEEYAYFAGHEAKRAHRRRYLTDIAGRLAGPLYGRLTSKEAAIRLLKTGARVLLAPQPQEAIA